MRIRDWSSDVCSSDLLPRRTGQVRPCREEIPAKRIAGIPVQPRCPALQQPFARAEANIGDEILAQEGADRIGSADGAEQLDRISVVSGKSVSVRVDPGCSCIF